MSEFIRHFLEQTQVKRINTKKVYDVFCDVVRNQYNNVEDVLKELLNAAKYYHIILRGKDAINYSFKFNNFKRIISLVEDSRNIENTPFTPILGLFLRYDHDRISEDNLIYAISLLNSYIFRRRVCELPSAGLGSRLHNLNKAVTRYEEHFSFNDAIRIFLIVDKKEGSGRFPRNQEFTEHLLTANLYKLKNNRFLFNSLEDYNNNTIINLNELSIEHIMPQKLNDQWKSELGKDHLAIHQQYLNTLGNLTLTGNNSHLSNSFIERKSELFKDYKHLKLNENLENINQ